MRHLQETEYGRFRIYYPSGKMEPSALISELSGSKSTRKGGRGGVKILSVDGKLLACRKYTHGGLFRAITDGLFLSEKRAVNEIETLIYLKENRFPVVHPFCVVVEKRFLTKNLYLLTTLEQNAVDLPEFLNNSKKKERFRIVRRLAQLIWKLECLGVYHRDLHLNNLLVTEEKNILFLDFDKARRNTMTQREVEAVFWRLNRFVEKMEKNGNATCNIQEKMLFLRTYERVSGRSVVKSMEKQLQMKRLGYRMGWAIESIIYGGAK